MENISEPRNRDDPEVLYSPKRNEKSLETGFQKVNKKKCIFSKRDHRNYEDRMTNKKTIKLDSFLLEKSFETDFFDSLVEVPLV